MAIAARTVEDIAAERAAFVHYLRTGRRVPQLEFKFNPNHDPDTGRFTTAEGGARSAEATQEAALSPALVARGAAMAIGLPADALGLVEMNIVGAPLASDMLPPDVLIAENNKQTRSKITGLQARIDQHSNKISKDPDNRAASHWRVEIRAWTAQIERLRKRLPGGR